MKANTLYKLLEDLKTKGEELEEYSVVFDTEAQSFDCHYVDIDGCIDDDWSLYFGGESDKVISLYQNSHGVTQGTLQSNKLKDKYNKSLELFKELLKISKNMAETTSGQEMAYLEDELRHFIVREDVKGFLK